MKKALGIVLLLFWMTLIFHYSAQPAEVSNETSDSWISRISETVSAVLGIEDSDVIESFLSEYVPFVRKGAHIGEYLILGLLASFNAVELIGNRTVPLSVAFCILYAISDEIHQIFVSGRAGMVMDVVIDGIGAMIGVFLYHHFMKKWKRN